MLLFINPFCESTDNPFEICVEHCECKYGNIIATRQELSDSGWAKVEELSHDVRRYSYGIEWSKCPECADKIVAEYQESRKLSCEHIEIHDYRPNPFFESFTQQPEVIEF